MRNLYIHVPFCDGKCDYCAFYSEPSPDAAAIRRWLDRILFQLEESAPRLGNAETVYFGGGTPSLLPEDVLNRLFSAVRAAVPAAVEISIEANPFTVTPEKASVLASFANRVTLGIQSFAPALLEAVGRRAHAGPVPLEAVRNLREAGLRNLGLDLMYGLPGETPELWRRDLELALELAPEHISAYSVTPEPGTPFARRVAGRPEDDALSETMWEQAGTILGAAGLPRYEISNYARHGFESRHNSNVWHGQTYLGLGPAACSFDGTDRWTQAADLRAWLDGAPPEIDRIPRRARLGEILMMGLRTVRGWTKLEFEEETDCTWDDFSGPLNELAGRGLVTLTEDTVAPTERGLAFWNDVAEMLVFAP
ncbi:MAG: radical SAM family heme chaperone HemW [Lentisphaeria bacterium]|nr:radical SAM family heme chaperone HemW [Lentisphaeria bacterium]